jgi:glycosyltransferase involved in cell wall biosynthesis
MALSRAASALAQRLIREQFQNRPFMLWINSISHFQGEIAKHLAPAAQFRVFDSTDALMMYERNENAAQLKQKHRLLESSDAVLCVNEHVMGRVAHPVKQIFPNCTEFGAFQRKDPNFQLAPLYPKPPGAVYIGFTGLLSGDLIDVDLLHALFTQFSKYQFVFVGETNRPSLLARLKTYSNFHFIPEVGYETLPAIVQGFDAAIIPHLDSDYSRGNDFNKVLDYLACGVPVVSTPSSNAEKYDDVVYMANSIREFAHVLEQLATRNHPHDPVPGMALARRQSWAQKVPELVEWLWDQQLDAQRAHQPAGAGLVSLSGAY